MKCPVCYKHFETGLEYCPHCHIKISGPIPAKFNAEKKRSTAGILAITVGALGIHKFYLRYYKPGGIYLFFAMIAAIFSSSLIGVELFILLWSVAIIEGVIYLKSGDSDFYYTYEKNKKMWF